jgi:ryanodine receptor 2
LSDREKERYKEPIRDALKALIAFGYKVITISETKKNSVSRLNELIKFIIFLTSSKIELSESSATGTLNRQSSRISQELHQSVSIQDYNPQPVDMTNLTLSRDMQTMAERLAENAHDMWAKTVKEESEALGDGIHPQMVSFVQIE